MRTYIYIDGFNFYYGAVKSTPYKWLDFKALFTSLLDEKHEIIRIKYFTARVSGKSDPDRPIRQSTYIRAVEQHIPEFQTYYGQFTTHVKIRPIAHNLQDPRYRDREFYVPVNVTEEKGSDVNLAVHLLNDAWRDSYDAAVVVSNDSDLAESLRLVSEDHKKTIGVISTRINRIPARKLKKHAKFYKVIRKGVLKISQLPDPIPGTNLRRPVSWSN